MAVKIPRRGQIEGPEAEMFIREARAAAQVKHPGVVGVHEVGREDGTLYIVSDFIDGCNLKEWLSGRQLTRARRPNSARRLPRPCTWPMRRAWSTATSSRAT